MGYEAVIFDLDGTLLDTLEDLGDATNTVLARFGFPMHTIASYRRMVGWGIRVLVTKALPEASRDEQIVERMTGEVDAYLRENPVTKTHPYPGIPELLTRLESAGVKMGIVTNKPDALTQLVVERLLGSHRFVGVHGQRSDLPRKPDPTTTLALCGRMGSTPAATIFLGDSEVDMQTARAAGMAAIGAEWGFRSAEVLHEAGADRIISAPGELFTLIDEGAGAP